jgi:hypothetical protein
LVKIDFNPKEAPEQQRTDDTASLLCGRSHFHRLHAWKAVKSAVHTMPEKMEDPRLTRPVMSAITQSIAANTQSVIPPKTATNCQLESRSTHPYQLYTACPPRVPTSCARLSALYMPLNP